MTTNTIGAPPEITLTQLQAWIWGSESALGPIIAIGNNGHSTAATFDWSSARPLTQATVKPLDQDQNSTPKGYTLVCQGDVYITNSVVTVGIYRASGG